ncbi:type II toxin-antitoxin system PemK/MazF family toxin [Bacillus cereus]|nr:type II toxin-antitoxin system PemK/MazF family toxin [Bacillus cereus]
MNKGTRSYYKSLLRKDTRGNRLVDGKLANEDPKLILDTLDTLSSYDRYFRKIPMYDAVNILLGLDYYIQDKIHRSFGRYGNRDFSRDLGRIVTVEFYGHFGTELTYEHPAIILASSYQWVIIAPISSPCYNDGKDTHVSLTMPLMSNNCGIMLENIRCVSKRRISNVHGKLTDPVKLAEIDEKIAKMLIPIAHKRYEKIQEDLEQVTEQLKQTQEDLERACKDIEEKDEEIARLREELTTLQSMKV